MANCEDLATKAELQELRDQLNALLGEKEDGGTEEIFRAGVGGASSLASAAATVYAGTKLRALQAITDIQLAGQTNNVIHANFANGSTTLKLVKGGGQSVSSAPLNLLGKSAGTGAAGAGLTAQAGVTAVAGLAVLSSLVQLGVNLALNKATVDILDNRIEAEARGTQLQIDAVNTSMLRLYDKQQGDIDAVVQQLDENQQIAEQNRQNLEATRTDLQNTNDVIIRQGEQLQTANNNIQALRTANEQLAEQLRTSNLEAQEITDKLTAQVEETQLRLTEAEEISNQQQITIGRLVNQVFSLEARTLELETKIQQLSLEYIHLREELWRLQEELSGDIDITNDRVTSLEGRIAKTQKFVKLNTGGASGAATGAAAQGQTSILELTSKLTGTDVDTPEITRTDIYNNTSTFQDTFQNLLTQLDSGASMNPEQLEEFRTNINTDFSTLLTTALFTNVTPSLDTIRNQTTRSVLVESSEEALCRSLNGQSSCPATPGNPNPTQGLKGLKDALAGNMDRINATLNTTILGFVQNTNSVVNSTTHGLAKIQSFAETAWRVTKADKIMQGVSLAMTVHNGMMLSNNLLSTVSEATNMTLNALNIRDETDTPIDIGAAIKGKITEILTTLLGAEEYAALTARIAKANRIYQSSINVLDTTYSLFDSARSVAELTAENTGKIGNALRESGAVYEDAYGEFLEKVNPQNASMRRLDKFREGLENVENVFSTINQISSGVVEFKENVEQLETEKEVLQEEITTALETQAEEKDTVKTQNQVGAEISENDFDRFQDNT